jgi:uncharacterized membrane protein
VVNFGRGITSAFTVDSATQITANIDIPPGAAPGAGDVLVTTPSGTATLSDGFRVIPQMPAGSHSSGGAASTTPATAVSPPTILVQSANLSAKVATPGTPVTVTAHIANRSTVNGSIKVTLYVNGQEETTQGVAVNSGSSAQLAFKVSRRVPGDYTVSVDGVPAGSFKVQMVTGNVALFIVIVVLVGITFVFGLVMLWRRHRTGYS